MRQQFIAALFTAFVAPAAADDVAPGGTLRAAYIGTNPAQATRDAATGTTRGPSFDLTVELGKAPRDGSRREAGRRSGGGDRGGLGRRGRYRLHRLRAVARWNDRVLADLSFGAAELSSCSMARRSARSRDIDRPGQKIAGVRDDSISLYLRRHLKQATLVEIANNPPETRRMLASKEIDAFGASRPRLSALVTEIAGTRLLADNLFGVPQTVILPKGKAAALEAVNRFIDDARASGLLKAAIEKSGVVGLEVAPGGSWKPTAP
jgi:polar amino acid transport system substrate-binding protein